MPTRVLLAIVLSACVYDTHFDVCAVHCTEDSGCPDDMTCEEGYCHANVLSETETVSCTTVVSTSPSCMGLAATCGPNADENCCSTATPIPGGTYYRSHDVSGDGMYPSLAYPATVSSFRLDRFEVTVGRFRAFVTAGQGTRTNPPTAGAGAHAKIPGSGWNPSWEAALVPDTAALVTSLKCDPTYQTWTDAAGVNENLPINCVTWYEAMAFCAWDGGFSPSENEWNYAAAGGAEQRAYPWSSPAGSTMIDCSYANYKIDTPSMLYCKNDPIGSVARVGTNSPKGDGRYGQSDLDGNVAEWTLDEFQDPYPVPCDDCTFTSTTDRKAIRGNGFISGGESLRTAVRNPKTPSKRGGDIGVRCAR